MALDQALESRRKLLIRLMELSGRISLDGLHEFSQFIGKIPVRHRKKSIEMGIKDMIGYIFCLDVQSKSRINEELYSDGYGSIDQLEAENIKDVDNILKMPVPTEYDLHVLKDLRDSGRMSGKQVEKTDALFTKLGFE